MILGHSMAGVFAPAASVGTPFLGLPEATATAAAELWRTDWRTHRWRQDPYSRPGQNCVEAAAQPAGSSRSTQLLTPPILKTHGTNPAMAISVPTAKPESVTCPAQPVTTEPAIFRVGRRIMAGQRPRPHLGHPHAQTRPLDRPFDAARTGVPQRQEVIPRRLPGNPARVKTKASLRLG